MKIGLDYIATVGHGGNAVYSRNIIDSLLGLGRGSKNAAEGSVTYHLYVFVHDFLLQRFGEYSGMKNVKIRPVFWSNLGLPIPKLLMNALNSMSFWFWTFVDRTDVFHFTNPLNFRRGFQKATVTTIHDLSPFHSDNWSKQQSAEFFRKFAGKILAESDAIVAVSEFTKRDIIGIFGVRPEKIVVSHEGASGDFYPDRDPEYIGKRVGRAEYIFYAGELQPRKNIANMLLAYAKLPAPVRQRFAFVLVGRFRDAAYESAVREIVQKSGIGDDVKFLGRVRVDELRKLYSSARAFLFVSLFEGFGLPVLESIRCGTPVLTSDTSSLPEVAGRAGILADPGDPSAIAEALGRLLSDDALYDILAKQCSTEAARFTWEKAAAKTFEAYTLNE